MPDTCLDTTKSQAPDVRLMRVAEHMARCMAELPDGYSPTNGFVTFFSVNQWREAILAVAFDLRATIGRPSEQAANVIQVLQATTTRGDVDTAWLDLAATVRQLPPCEQSRVIVEARIAEAKAAKKGRFW